MSRVIDYRINSI